MIADLESNVISMIQMLFDTAGWLGVAALLAFESATGLTPSEVILGLAGWMLLASHGEPPTAIYLAGLYATLGSLVGTSFTYWLVRLGGRPLVERAARWLRLDPRYILYVEAQFQRWGPGLVCIGRVLPGIRILINVPAGLARMNFPKFLLFSFIGNYIWCTLIIGLGYSIGNRWTVIMELVNRYLPFMFIALAALLVLGLVVTRFFRRRVLAQAFLAVQDQRE